MSTEKELPVDDDFEKETAKTSGRFGVRHTQALFWFTANVIGYCLRVCMSEAIVAMTEPTSNEHNFDIYEWNSDQRSTILGAFFWGYTVMQIPSGYIARIWSAQKLLSFGMLICGVLNIVTPVAAKYGGFMAVCACRVCMGLCQSCLLPCTHTLLSKWTNPNERSRFGAFSYAGAQFGTVISFPISGLLAESALGWPTIFYFFGALGIIWSVTYIIFGYDTPSTHPRITDMEMQHIHDSSETCHREDASTNKEAMSPPWKAIFTSVPMWALIIVHCGQNWGYWTLVTEMPLYMNGVLKFNMAQNGLMSALPYLTMWILSFPMSWLSDYALQKGVARGIVRKVCNTIAHWGPAIALVCLAALPIENNSVVITILAVAVGLNAGALCGFQINHIDLSPNFAGTMMSITNCIASVIAIIAPQICGRIVLDHKNKAYWSTVFYISAFFYFLGNLIFIIFGKAKVQSWNDPTPPKIKKQSIKDSAA